MGTLAPTQTELDDTVLTIGSYFVELTEVAADQRGDADPEAYNREEEMMMLFNVYDALRFYDVSSGVLSNEEIRYLTELASVIIENCPI